MVIANNLIYPGSPLLPTAGISGLARIKYYLDIKTNLLSSISAVVILIGMNRYRDLISRLEYTKWAYGINQESLNLYLQGYLAPPLLIMAAQSRILQPTFDINQMVEISPEKHLFIPAARQVSLVLSQITPYLSDDLLQTSKLNYALFARSVNDPYYEAGNIASKAVFDSYIRMLFPFSTANPSD